MENKQIIERLRELLPKDFWDFVEEHHPNYNSEKIGRSNDLNQYINNEIEDDETRLSLEKEYGEDNIPLEAALADLEAYIEALQAKTKEMF